MFKTTERKKLEAAEVAASAHQFQGNVQEGLNSFFAAELLDGETVPDLRFLQELIGRKLGKNGNGLMVADDNHTRELVSGADLRRQRNQLSAELRVLMRDGRFLLDRAIGGAAAKAALRDRRVSKSTPASLAQGARQVAETLRDPKYAGSGSGLLSAAESVATTLEEAASQLEQVLGLLSPQKKSSQGSLEEKVRDIEAASRETQRCSELLFGLYRVAGLDFHADRVRPTSRRRRIGSGNEAMPEAGAGTSTEPSEAAGLVN